MPNIPLSNIPTLSLLYKLGRLKAAEKTVPNASSRYNDKISIIRADTTTLETAAIVNAANEGLLGGGGVDGAIHRAAGRSLYNECRTLGGCDTGDAKITDAYNLPSQKVVHAVGPIYVLAKRNGMHTTLLQSCYTRSLDLAVEHGCKSIAFSAISAGTYEYPTLEAAETSIAAVKGWLDKDEERSERLEKIVFCIFVEQDEKAYEHHLP